MKIRGVELGRAPKTVGVVVDEIKSSVVKRSLEIGADCLELRVDTFRDRRIGPLAGAVKKLARALPIIITVRSGKEGGKLPIPDTERISLFNALMPFADMVDIELSSSENLKSVIKSAHRLDKKVIISYHNFKTTPGLGKLQDIIKKGRDAGGDVVKIAALAKGKNDLLRLASVLIDSKDLIVIAMGSYGRPSRVFFPMLGSLLTYGSLTGETAPGQIPLRTIKKELELYGFSSSGRR
jgi:3-dehydroquinate dehydratase I